MTIAYLTPRGNRFGNYEYAETIANGATGNTVFIPGLTSGKYVGVTIIAGANTGKIQYSTSLESAVKAGTAVFQDWEMGTVSGTVTESFVINVSAIRGVSVSGEIKIEVII